MRSDDDAALRFEVYAEMVEGDDLGILAVKEGACDAVCTLVGVDGEGNGIRIVVTFFRFHFTDIDVAFLCDASGVDEVDGLLEDR